jgi:hypothetical protein
MMGTEGVVPASVPTADGFGRGVLVFFIMFIFLALMKWEIQIWVYRSDKPNNE